MKPVSSKIEAFQTELHYSRDDVLEVILFDRKLAPSVFVSASFEIIEDDNSMSGDIAGFKLWGVKDMLCELNYKKPSIALQELFEMFIRHNEPRTTANLFGRYEKQILAAVRNSLVVWKIPK